MLFRSFGHGYTIGPNGLRVSPPYEEVADVPCALFFGGSFTFGTGVEDDEALPYVAGILSEGKYRVYNFGYRGYGPHQMLAALESGLRSEERRVGKEWRSRWSAEP